MADMLTGLASRLPGTNIRLKEISIANVQRRRCGCKYTLEFELVAVVERNVDLVLQSSNALADIVLVIRFDSLVLE